MNGEHVCITTVEETQTDGQIEWTSVNVEYVLPEETQMSDR